MIINVKFKNIMLADSLVDGKMQKSIPTCTFI